MSVKTDQQRTRRSSSSVESSSNNGGGPSVNKNISPLQQNAGGNPRGGMRRRHRRACKGGEKHRRKWKPYDKLSWEEKRLLGEKEEKTAEKRREDALRLGYPVAPFNTTQFIMEEHSGGKGITPRMVASRSLNAGSGNPGSGHCSGFCSQQDTPLRDDGDDNDVYFEREYSAALETLRAERLQSMNSQQLRSEVLRLEVDIDAINKKHQTMLATKDAELAQLRAEIARQKELLSRLTDNAEVAMTKLTQTTTTTLEQSVSSRKNSTDQQGNSEPVSPQAN